MGLPWVLEAFTSIFNTGSISNKCCGELVVLGKVFHSALVKRTLENPLFKDLNPATIIAKSIQTWNNYLALFDSPSPTKHDNHLKSSTRYFMSIMWNWNVLAWCEIETTSIL
ncbi:hypothetical protein V6Z11_A04G058400 [Gossypium hirsutum]